MGLAGLAVSRSCSRAPSWSRPVLPRLRALFLTQGMNTLTIGTFIMAAGGGPRAPGSSGRVGVSVAGWSGGIGFLFGAMWFGAGIKQLRGK